MVIKSFSFIKMFVLGFQNAKSGPVHFYICPHIRSINQTVTILFHEGMNISWNRGQFAITGSNIRIKIGVFIKKLSKSGKVRAAVGQMTGYEDYIRVIPHSILQRLNQLIMEEDARLALIHMPGSRI